MLKPLDWHPNGRGWWKAETPDTTYEVADALDDLFHTETFDSVKLLADFWQAHWARRHDVNEPVTK